MERLFAGDSVPAYCSRPEGLRLWTANDRELELEAVAREICRLVREEGLHYRDISVLCRDTACYESLLSDTLGRAQIPYFIDSKKLLLYHPLVELLRAVLEVWAEKPGYRPMFRLLKNRLSPIFGERADLLENYCLAHGVRFYHWSRLPWQFPLLHEDAETEALVAQVNEIAGLAAGPVMKFLAAVGNQSTAACFHAAFNQLLADWQVQNRLNALIDAALAAGDGEMAAEHAQAQKLLLDFFAEAEFAMGEVELSGEEMRDLYETALSGLTFSTIPPGLDQVMIGSLERSRNPEIRAEFLLGAVEGELPRRIVMDGLFRDADRQLLATQGIQLAKDSKSLQFGENYLAYIGLTRSSERLYVSYPQNVEGQVCQPSPLVRRLFAAFPQLVLEKVGFVQDASQLLSGAAEISTMAAGLRRNPLEPLWQAVYQHYASHSAYAEALKQVRYGLYFSANRQTLSKGLLRRMHGGTLRGSVSRLERFRRCPFSYFAAYGLKLQQRREFGLTARERGDLYHYVLSAVGLYLRERKIAWEQVDEQLAELLVDRVLHDCLPQFLAGIMSSSSRYAYLSHRLKRALVAAVLLVARQLSQGAFIPVAYELPFGNVGQPDALPAFYLKLPDGRHMELSGRIDRVDMAEDVENGIAYFRIIDYKTGQASISSEDIAAGLKLQLLLYLQVVLANSTVFTVHTPAPAGAYYITVNDTLPLVDTPDKLDSPSIRANGLSVDDAHALRLCDTQAARPRSSKSLLSVEQLDALREQLTAVLQETATAMLDGMIEVSPLLDKVDNACKYCDYQAVCCFDRQLAKSRRRMEPLPQAEDKLAQQGNRREDEA